jgi:hypothetical protein
MAEGRGFEPPVGLPLRLISSQVPLTTQPPFHSESPADIMGAQRQTRKMIVELERVVAKTDFCRDGLAAEAFILSRPR